jgi:hypothetical protein
MNAGDKALLTDLQDCLLNDVLRDATASAHHDAVGKLYARVQLHMDRKRPFLEHFTNWCKSPENCVRDNPKAVVLVYVGLFPGRMADLLLELTT